MKIALVKQGEQATLTQFWIATLLRFFAAAATQDKGSNSGEFLQLKETSFTLKISKVPDQTFWAFPSQEYGHNDQKPLVLNS